MTTQDRPGTDWLRPEATTAVRSRDTRQRRALVGASLVTGAVLLGAWLATGQVRADAEPLSFFLEEQKPEATGSAFEHQLGAFSPYFDNVKPFLAAVSASACTSDVDNDGDLDLYMTNAGAGTKNALFLNQLDKGAAFKFVRADLPMLDGNNGDDGFSSDCVFADVDNDGFDDLLVGTIAQAPHLFHNEAVPGAPDGARTFMDISKAAGLPDYMNGFADSFVDVDNDGDLDLVMASYFGETYLEEDIPGHPRIHNTKNTADATTASGRTFQNVAADLGAKDGGWGWGAKFVDLDLDGDYDLVETNGYITGKSKSEYWYRLSRLVVGDRRLIVDTRKWPKFEDKDNVIGGGEDNDEELDAALDDSGANDIPEDEAADETVPDSDDANDA
jgi:hypothetical protein